VTGLLLSLVVASTPITLDEVRSEARNNLQAMVAELTRVQAYEQIAINRGALLPQGQLIAGAQRRWSDKPSAYVSNGQVLVASTVVNNFSLQVTLSQILIDVGRWNTLAQSGAQEAAAAGQAEDLMEASEFEAVRRFYALFTAQRSLAVLEETAQKSKELLGRANALYEAGRGTKGDALAAQVNYATDLNNAIQQRQAVVQAQADLASWVGRSETESLVAVEPAALSQPGQPAPTFDEALGTAKLQRGILRATLAQIRAADAGVWVATSGYIPRLNFAATYTRGSNNYTQAFWHFNENWVWTAGLNLSWTFFDGLSTPAAVRQAKAVVASNTLTYSQTERDVSGQLRTALSALGLQTEALAVLVENRETATKNLDYFQERFKAGASNTLEVRDAQVKLLGAELSLAQTRANVEVARASLERAMGTLGNNGAKP
jgi:outer membrane protein TolC